MCHLVFRAGELVGGNMSSCYCSITDVSVFMFDFRMINMSSECEYD